MVQEHIHKNIVENLPKVEEWFKRIRAQVDVPFYSSYDIRDSGFKIANVDANIYPAGFNNICPADQEHGGALIKKYLDRHYNGVTQSAGQKLDQKISKILILTEEHTNNPYYWENVRALNALFIDAKLDVRVGIPRLAAEGSVQMKTSSGHAVDVHAAIFKDGHISVKDFIPDLVISNNDFSEFYAELGPQIVSPLNPPRELGWYQRKKSNYFQHYNRLATELSEIIQIEPWRLTVETELFDHFDLGVDESRDRLAEQVDQMIARLKKNYQVMGIDQPPFVFVKNNSGTYGLGVMRVGSGEEIKSLNYKTRKKMKAAKGGRDIEQVIIQEGIPSIVRAEGITAEPAIYLIGCQLLGGFLRTHSEKDATESLNSPGAVYKRMCVSDMSVNVAGHPLENVYGWIAKLGVLAIGLEAQGMGVEYKAYRR